MIIPQLTVTANKDGSDGEKLICRDRLAVIVLQEYESTTETTVEAQKDILRAHIDDMINQLCIIRACI